MHQYLPPECQPDPEPSFDWLGLLRDMLVTFVLGAAAGLLIRVLLY